MRKQISLPLSLTLLGAVLSGSASGQLAWSETEPQASPSARFGHTMTRVHPSYEPVLFGGTNGAVAFADTWRWDGQNWFRLASDGPSPRHDHVMGSLHFEDDSLLVFGGRDANGDLLGWRRIGILDAPVADQTLVFENLWRRRVMAFGGSSDVAPNDDTVERLQSGTWVKHETLGAPSPRDKSALALAWQPNGAGFVLFGGRDRQGTALDDTWTLEPVTAPAIENFGQGCGPGAWSPDGGPDLFVFGPALLGASLTITAYTPTPGRAIFAIGEEIFTLPVDCGLLVAPTQFLSAPVQLLFEGLAQGDVDLEIPFEPSLLGHQISLQAIVGPSNTPQGVSISFGLRITLAE